MFKKTVTVVINNCEGDRLEKKKSFFVFRGGVLIDVVL